MAGFEPNVGDDKTNISRTEPIVEKEGKKTETNKCARPSFYQLTHVSQIEWLQSIEEDFLPWIFNLYVRSCA